MPLITHSTPLTALEAVALDLETTGLDPRKARIVQVAMVHLSGPHVDARPCFNSLINPGIPIPAVARSIHGISDEMVAAAPAFATVIPAVDSLVSGVIIGHAIAYDLAVLAREYQLAQRPWKAPPRSLCVRTLAQVAAPALPEHTLEHLCAWLNIDLAGRHTAAGDALAAARIFVALVPLLRQRGIHTLAEAEAAVSRVGLSQAQDVYILSTKTAIPESGIATLSRIDSFPYRHRVRDVMSTPPVFVSENTTAGEAITLLLERKVSSVFVRVAEGPPGIVTERDLLRIIDRNQDLGLATMMGSIASKPLETVHEVAFIYRAIGRMDRLGIRHLGVRNDDGEIVGAVTPRNLLRQRATAAIMLGDEIEGATAPAALGRAWARVPLVARGLLSEDIDAHLIAAVISSEICALTRRGALLAEADLGTPPVPYTVLVLGSAGRGESLLAADQDNAIVYASGEPDGPEDRYFAQLGNRMCQTLDEVGVRFCKGGVMAKNAQWRMSRKRWQETIDSWVLRQRPEDLLNVDIFYDGVPVHGDPALGETVLSHAYARGRSAPDFLKLLALASHQYESPFTLLRRLRVDANGRIDLKKVGLLPIHTCARVVAIRHGIRTRATPDRLRGLLDMGLASTVDVHDIIEAHRTLLDAVLDQQLEDGERGIPLSSKVAPTRLSTEDRSKLRSALGDIGKAVHLVDEGRL
jgi:DNA polymerase-3 subunit epsilon/CBS domain-containing protein